MPLTEFTKVVGVPGSCAGAGAGAGEGEGEGEGEGDGDVSLQPTKITAVANKRQRENPAILSSLYICALLSISWLQLC